MKILILASNPRKDLNLDREIRDLKDVIERSRNLQQLEVVDELAVRVGDLQNFLFKHQPQIVHFCGHGSGREGLVFEGNEGEEQWVRADALAGLFEFFPGVSCVLLNACYSEAQADAIVTHIDYVIGMRQTIRDDAAIAFSKGFYRALGYEFSIEQSYGLGCNAIQLEISGSSKRSSPARSAVSEQERRAEVVNVIATTALKEHEKPILKKKAALSEASGSISAETLVAIQVEVDKALEEEDSSQKQYRDRVKEYLSDHKLSEFETIRLKQLRRNLGLTEEEVDQILAEELEPIQRSQEDYQEMLNSLIAAGCYPFSADIAADLQNLRQELQLTDAEVEEISQPIFAAVEAAQQAEADRLNAEERQQRQAEADRLRREAEERQRREQARLQAEADQQAEADRRRRETEERQRQEQARRKAEADRRRREAEQTSSTPTQSFYAPPVSPSASPTHTASSWSRRRVIRTAGLAALGVAGTGIAVTGGRLLQQQKPPPAPTLETASVTVNDKGEVIDRRPVQVKGFVEQLGNGITLEMVQIPGGKFSMGSPSGESQRGSDESPQHQVTVSPFAIGKFEVTQAQWKAIASLPKVKIELKADPSNFKGSDRPVEQASWNEAIEFCDRLSVKTGKKCRLPSEAEWEYACRARTTTPFNVGATLSTDLANYDGSFTYSAGVKGEYRKQTIAVGSFPPNAFGLYDMHGNVLEWCADRWHENYQGAPVDGSAWTAGNSTLRMLRGGYWVNAPQHCRSATRDMIYEEFRSLNLGFRVVCSAPRTELSAFPSSFFCSGWETDETDRGLQRIGRSPHLGTR